MRTDNDILKLIVDKAVSDVKIRAVTLNGSRASETATKDKYSDFDIVYFVTDVCDFTKNKEWINEFGDILIVQYSMDWYTHPYDYSSQKKFIYLIQFADGHRIDLSIVHTENIKDEMENMEPRIILLNKDERSELINSIDESKFYVNEPSQMEFYNTCNEFRWLSIYISKGLCREEIYYAKYAYDVLTMGMFVKMLSWKIGIENEFSVSIGSHKKYLKRYLSEKELRRFQAIFPNGNYDDIWETLILMYDYFHEIEQIVCDRFGFNRCYDEIRRVREYLCDRKKEYYVAKTGFQEINENEYRS